jgi:hypothetical protein
LRVKIAIFISLLLFHGDQFFVSPGRVSVNMDLFIPRFSFSCYSKKLPTITFLLLLMFYCLRRVIRTAHHSFLLFSLLLLFLLFASAGNVTAANLPPEAIDARNFPIQTGSGLSQILPLIGKDADGSIVSFKILTLPGNSKGTLYLNGVAITVNQILTPTQAQMLQFTPKNTYTGDCSFTFTVTDNEGLTDATPANYIIPVVPVNQNLVCTGGGLGTNILGAMGTFSVPFIVPRPQISCINDGLTPSSPLNNIGISHPELTSYTYASTSGSLGPEGAYSFLKIIGTWASRNCIKTDWVAADHTGDGGYAMIVNGSPNITKFGSTFFKANAISVCPNTLYEFSAFVINVLPGNHSAAITGSEPDISFYINNTKVSQSGLIRYSDASTAWVPQWVKVGGLWYSGQNTSVDLRIDNATFVASGNDLGMDDISLAICGPDISYPNTDLDPKFCKPGILPLEALVTASINTYSHYIFENSTDDGVTWQVLSVPKTGSPVYDGAANTYSYIATYGYIPVDASMNGYKYRLKVATTETNLNGELCNVSAVKVITVAAFTTPDAGADITGCNPLTTAQLAPAPAGQTWLTVANNPSPAATINNAGSITGMTVNGIYKFQLSNTAGCYDTVNVVRDQVGNAGADVHVCTGATTYKLKDAGAGYAWETVAGNPVSATVNSITGAVDGMTSAGSYHFVLRSSFGGCTDEVIITVATVISASASATAILCNGGVATVTIDGTGGTAPLLYTFNGVTNGTGIFGGIPAGAGYTWSVTDANNCILPPGLISITQPPLLSSSATVLNATCPGASNGSAIATATGGVPPYGYSWNTIPGQTTSTAGNLAEGTYQITVTDNNGCVTTPVVTIISQDLIPPTFNLPLLNSGYCVEYVTLALYNPDHENTPLDITYARPDYYLFTTGSTLLDLSSVADNCALTVRPISWTIDFGNNGSIELSGIGQLSAYASDIRFPLGTSRINYTVTDAAGNVSAGFTDLLITPRPDISKNF